MALMPYGVIEDFKHKLEITQKKWVFKDLSTFRLKSKQNKQRKTNNVRSFMKFYALSVNFKNLKSKNFLILCQVAGF